MITMRKLGIIVLTVIFAVSCTKDIEHLNENKKDPTDVPGESVFSSAQKRLVDQILTPNVNSNNMRLFVQHWQETTYNEESQYDQRGRSVPDNHWSTMYRDVLMNLKKSGEIIEQEDDPLTNDAKNNKLAIIELLKVYTYSNLVETFGDIPYDDALKVEENTLPSFQDAEEVYYDLISRLNAALEQFDDGGSFDGEEDLIYQGDIEAWKKFGNTLKLRMGIILADVDKAKSVELVNAAYSAGVFQSNADDAGYQYDGTPPNDNQVYENVINSGRHDYVAAETIIGTMNDLEDPRRPYYFQENLGEGVFKGGTIGVGAPDSDFDANSHPGEQMIAADAPGYILTYVEAEFYLAEAAARGGYEVSDPEEHYDAAIRASFEKWEVENAADQAEDYLAKSAVDYTTALSNSTSSPAWKEVIGTQAWLGMYGQTFAPYISVRRLGYPVLKQPNGAYSGFPNRYYYPVDAENLNEDSWNEAKQHYDDDATEALQFWQNDNPQDNWNW